LAGELTRLQAGEAFETLTDRYETVETDVETT
jgi:hypothetical protein